MINLTVVNTEELTLVQYIPKLSPEYRPPYHLAEWCDQFELAAKGIPVRALCAAPIRHGKTQTTLHGIVWLLKKDPSARYLLLSHSFERSQALGKRLRQLADAAGVGPARGTNTIADWATDKGGGVIIMSADQSRLGYDVHGLFFDDPIDESGAQDSRKRDEVDETISHYTARCMRSGRPGPVMGVMSRWHPDDPIGRRLLRTSVTWKYIHYPAIIDEGLPSERAFAPDVWPLEELQKMRAELRERDPTERIWHAQLMGDPRPAGADLFRDPVRYTSLPDLPSRVAYGCDFAFTQGDQSDYFALVVARVYGRKSYVAEVYRHKIDAHQIESTIRSVQNKYGRGVVWSYQSGPEIGLTNILVERGLPIMRIPARYNKLVRAERTIKRWNDGDILIPNEAMWAPGFLARVGAFRGHDKDGDDDEIDALVSLCDGALGGAATAPTTLGRPGYSGI